MFWYLHSTRFGLNLLDLRVLRVLGHYAPTKGEVDASPPATGAKVKALLTRMGTLCSFFLQH